MFPFLDFPTFAGHSNQNALIYVICCEMLTFQDFCDVSVVDDDDIDKDLDNCGGPSCFFICLTDRYVCCI